MYIYIWGLDIYIVSFTVVLGQKIIPHYLETKYLVYTLMIYLVRRNEKEMGGEERKKGKK